MISICSKRSIAIGDDGIFKIFFAWATYMAEGARNRGLTFLLSRRDFRYPLSAYSMTTELKTSHR